MSDSFDLQAAQLYLRDHNLDGWLVYDFHHTNPIFWQVVGGYRHTTRRAFLLVPPDGSPRFLLHFVDANRLVDLGWPIETYLSRADQDAGLSRLLEGCARVAMEYSSGCALPVVSRVDAGTIEEIVGRGLEVVSSCNLLQFAVARWSHAQAQSHQIAAQAVTQVAKAAFGYIRQNLDHGVDELQVVQFINDQFAAAGLQTEDGPIVAVNAHSGDPHYEPTRATSAPIRRGDWVLIDLWAKQTIPGTIYGDTTWVGYVGTHTPVLYSHVFEIVRMARDGAVRLLADAWSQGRILEGWEVDHAARASIETSGYGHYFNHRLGHSIGEAIHSNGVNLDSFETRDTRQIVPGVGFSVEPGVYLPEFGVRLEVDVYVDPVKGPIVTTPSQDHVVMI